MYTDHVGINESVRCKDTAVYMCLGGEVHHCINIVHLEGTEYGFAVSNIALLEAKVRCLADRQQVIGVSSVRQLVEHDNIVLRIFAHHTADKSAANEARAARDQNIFHTTL